MKIHWVNPSFLDYRVPLYKAINELADGNFHVTYSKNRVPERIINKIELALGSNAHGLSEEKILHFGKKGDFANQGINIPIQKGLVNAIKSIPADLIITEGFFQWAPFAAYVAKKMNIPLWLAYERTKHTERSCPYWRTAYRRIFDEWVSGYLVNGLFTEEYLIDNIRVKDKPLIKGCMSADSEGLALQVSQMTDQTIQEFKQNLRLNSGMTYLFVGQLIDRKGISPLLQAWTKHILEFPEDNLLIIGTGDLEKPLKKKYAELPSVFFIGAADYDQVYNYYGVSDVFIMPTLEDNWSLVIPEAMACGLPVATTYYNGCYPELIQEGKNGFVFDSLRQEDILRTLKAFKQMDLKAMGRESQRIEQDFSTQVVAGRIFNSLKDFFERSKRNS